MKIGRLYEFVSNPMHMPCYLFNREIARDRMKEARRDEYKQYEENDDVARRVPSILSGTNWREFQTHQYFESWSKALSADFSEERFNVFRSHDKPIWSGKRNGMDSTGRKR
jgi:hypothetical protein